MADSKPLTGRDGGAALRTAFGLAVVLLLALLLALGTAVSLFAQVGGGLGAQPVLAASGKATNTPTPTPTNTPSGPTCKQSGQCFVFEYLGYVTNGNGQTTITFRVINKCTNTVGYVAIGTDGFTRLAPANGNVYMADGYANQHTDCHGDTGGCADRPEPDDGRSVRQWDWVHPVGDFLYE